MWAALRTNVVGLIGDAGQRVTANGLPKQIA
jgi:hypothetical protein